MAGELETITVVRKPGRDKFGDQKTGTTIEFNIDGCQFAPGFSHEVNFGAQQVDVDATVYAPAGADVLATDQIRRKGVLYDVAGFPQDWGSAGVVVALKRVTG